ncbi:hypothetical protein F66182_5230 [Fusarium sp. NRRL 66182]|nr:hypothetical protein F66182_5230 [Fusarium sp. NRRL 66182]
MSGHTHHPHQEGHLRPRLSKITMVAMTFAILNTWICLAGSLSIVLPSGGSVAFLYGFIFCVLCNFALAASLGELAAIWPTAGGLGEHIIATAILVSSNEQQSFAVGYINICGWLTLVTTEGFFAAQFISAACVVASGGNYVVAAWKTYLIFMAILTFGSFSMAFGNRILGAWNNLALYWSILSVFVASVVLLSTSDKTDPGFVFATFENETGWNDGIAWILGLLQSALSLIGYDAVLHMTEEMPSPARDAPLAMVYAIGVGGTTGTVFILVMLFCLTDLPGIVATSTGMPIVELILQATGSRIGTTFLTLMLAICFIHGTNGSITSASRLIYAMARDKGVLYHDYFNHVDARWEVPIRAIVLTWVFNAIFGLLYLGPTVAFTAFISSCTILLNMSYAIPILALIVRGRDVLTKFRTADSPWMFGRVKGYILNAIAVLYVFITSLFFCFPPALPVTASSMNYVSAVIGIFFLFLAGYWMAYAKKTFEGPHLDVIFGERPGHAEASDKLAMEEKMMEYDALLQHHHVTVQLLRGSGNSSSLSLNGFAETEHVSQDDYCGLHAFATEVSPRPSVKRKLPIRSRSGCLTCRNKHLKCDEARPACQVCISRGVQCGGYQRGLRWSTKHEKPAEMAEHKHRLGGSSLDPQPCTSKRRRGRPPKRQLDSASTPSFTAASSVYSSSDANQGVFGEFMLENSQPLDGRQSARPSEVQSSQSSNDFVSQFSLDMPVENLPDHDFGWSPDTLDLTTNLGDFCNSNTELPFFPLQHSFPTLFIPPPITDPSSSLVEYWFRDVCSLWSQYDSPTNSNRTMATALWSTSEAVSTSLQSMSSAYLSSKMPHMKKTSISLMKNATNVIEAELSVVKSSPDLDTVPMGLIYGLFCLGTSICWLNASQLGIPFLREAKALLCRINKQKRRLSEEERVLLNIFNKSWTYCELLLSVVSDTNPYNSLEVEEIDDISVDEHPTAAPTEPVVDDMPHPWTGVSNTVSRLLTQTLRLCRNYHYHAKNPTPFTTHDHAAALSMIQEAKSLEEKLLGLDFESAPAHTETGDQKTPCHHLVNVAEAYRLAGLIHIYQTFPDLVLLRFPDSLSSQPDARVPWEECITPLSIRLVKLLEQLPADSGSKMTQPLLCITASTGLRFEPSENSPISPESQASAATPSPFDLGNTEHCGLSDYIDQLVQADEDIDRVITVTEPHLKIVDARCFIIGRLDALEALLPPRPIVIAKTLVQTIWGEYDKEKPGAASVHWIDVMEEHNLRSLFG